jgi:hypothetical protein
MTGGVRALCSQGRGDERQDCSSDEHTAHTTSSTLRTHADACGETQAEAPDIDGETRGMVARNEYRMNSSQCGLYVRIGDQLALILCFFARRLASAMMAAAPYTLSATTMPIATTAAVV